MRPDQRWAVVAFVLCMLLLTSNADDFKPRTCWNKYGLDKSNSSVASAFCNPRRRYVLYGL